MKAYKKILEKKAKEQVAEDEQRAIDDRTAATAKKKREKAKKHMTPVEKEMFKEERRLVKEDEKAQARQKIKTMNLEEEFEKEDKDLREHVLEILRRKATKGGGLYVKGSKTKKNTALEKRVDDVLEGQIAMGAGLPERIDTVLKGRIKMGGAKARGGGWIAHVKKYAKDNGISYKEALSQAGKTWKK